MFVYYFIFTSKYGKYMMSNIYFQNKMQLFRWEYLSNKNFSLSLIYAIFGHFTAVVGTTCTYANRWTISWVDKKVNRTEKFYRANILLPVTEQCPSWVTVGTNWRFWRLNCNHILNHCSYFCASIPRLW